MRDSYTYRIAELAVHLGIAPSEFINMDRTMLNAIHEVLRKQGEQRQNANRAIRRR